MCVQPKDVADAVMYVLDSKVTCCPVEIILYPPKSYISDVERFRDKNVVIKPQVPITKVCSILRNARDEWCDDSLLAATTQSGIFDWSKPRSGTCHSPSTC